MKKGIFIIVLLLLGKPVLPVLEYALNYEYIAAELCENKAKPELHCNGKCHLMKELAKASESEKPLSQKKVQQAEFEVLFCESVPDFSLPFFTLLYNPVPDTYSDLYTFCQESHCFHPPAVI